MKYVVIASFGVLSVLAVSACSNEQKKDLGLMKKAPDEFAVVTRAPLSRPPEYSLRPPRPGAARPMETSTVNQARQTVFGVEDVKPVESGEVSPEFMDKIGVQEADSSIRDRLEEENGGVRVARGPVFFICF